MSSLLARWPARDRAHQPATLDRVDDRPRSSVEQRGAVAVVDGLRQAPLVVAVSRSTRPISFRYMRTVSAVLPTSPPLGVHPLAAAAAAARQQALGRPRPRAGSRSGGTADTVRVSSSIVVQIVDRRRRCVMPLGGELVVHGGEHVAGELDLAQHVGDLVGVQHTRGASRARAGRPTRPSRPRRTGVIDPAAASTAPSVTHAPHCAARATLATPLPRPGPLSGSSSSSSATACVAVSRASTRRRSTDDRRATSSRRTAAAIRLRASTTGSASTSATAARSSSSRASGSASSSAASMRAAGLGHGEERAACDVVGEQLLDQPRGDVVPALQQHRDCARTRRSRPAPTRRTVRARGRLARRSAALGDGDQVGDRQADVRGHLHRRTACARRGWGAR